MVEGSDRVVDHHGAPDLHRGPAELLFWAIEVVFTPRTDQLVTDVAGPSSATPALRFRRVKYMAKLRRAKPISKRGQDCLA